MKRPTVDPIKQAFRKRLSWEDLRDMPNVDRTHVLPHALPSKDTAAYEEPCYAVFNGIVWDLNEMTECNPDHIPEGWDGIRSSRSARCSSSSRTTVGNRPRWSACVSSSGNSTGWTSAGMRSWMATPRSPTGASAAAGESPRTTTGSLRPPRSPPPPC